MLTDRHTKNKNKHTNTHIHKHTQAAHGLSRTLARLVILKAKFKVLLCGGQAACPVCLNYPSSVTGFYYGLEASMALRTGREQKKVGKAQNTAGSLFHALPVFAVPVGHHAGPGGPDIL